MSSVAYIFCEVAMKEELWKALSPAGLRVLQALQAKAELRMPEYFAEECKSKLRSPEARKQFSPQRSIA